MNLEQVSQKYPIGSKLVATFVGRRQSNLEMECKVVGYSKYSNRIFVYNPEIEGHSGVGCVVSGYGTTISSTWLENKYGEHCWFIDCNTLDRRL